jgi:hypothetical protein
MTARDLLLLELSYGVALSFPRGRDVARGGEIERQTENRNRTTRRPRSLFILENPGAGAGVIKLLCCPTYRHLITNAQKKLASHP